VADGGAMFEQCKYLENHPKDETFGWRSFYFPPGNDVKNSGTHKQLYFSSLSKENKLTINTGRFSTQHTIFLEKSLLK
jgi:hypothetical protein